ncbi:hypothetical protein VWZ88_01275 [Phaeobacter sp. JH20_36]|uniref:hypothetical protein n=1 Tax=unclassified Phaeobacter TaxID=2621772 RepID=UPI003A8445F7
MLETFTDSKIRALDNMRAKDKFRLRNPATGEFLHMSGQTPTSSTAYAWLGFRHQADELQRRALASGQDWPFVTIHRSLIRDDQQPGQPDHVEA